MNDALCKPEGLQRVFFARISRVRSSSGQMSCLNEQMSERAYDEQREREKQSFSSLLVRAPHHREASASRDVHHRRQ